jgi:hypothetical protein
MPVLHQEAYLLPDLGGQGPWSLYLGPPGLLATSRQCYITFMLSSKAFSSAAVGPLSFWNARCSSE